MNQTIKGYSIDCVIICIILTAVLHDFRYPERVYKQYLLCYNIPMKEQTGNTLNNVRRTEGKRTVFETGKSLGVTLPKAYTTELGIEPGDKIEFYITNEQHIIFIPAEKA